MKRPFDSRLVALLVIVLAVAPASTWLLRKLQSVHSLELLVYRWHVSGLPAIPADDRIVIVGMDEESLSRLPLERPSYPLPRSFHAHLLDELRQGDAKAVGFDIMFTREIPAEDTVFAKSLELSGNAFCGVEPNGEVKDGRESVRFTKNASLLRPYVRGCSLLAPRPFGQVLWILPAIADAETSERYPHITMALAASYLGVNASDAVLRTTFDVGPIHAPLGPEGELFIRFAGPAGTFKPIPYHEVYSGEWRRTRGEAFFKDKIVLVGMISPLVDRAITPFGDIQGVEVLAQTTQAILQSNWFTPWSEFSNYAFKIALSAVLAFAVWALGLRRALIVAAIEVGLWVLVAHRVFAWRGIWIDTVEPLGTLVLSLGALTSFETNRIRRVFHRFMPSHVADEMLHADASHTGKSEEKDLTIVFCDVRDSTKLGEKLTPEQFEKLLREYFNAGEDAALQLGTELDKFVGDEIMLFFEDRPGLEDHAMRGVRWALAIQEACKRITESGMAGDIGFRVGVGVCTGRARMGMVGAKQRIQHTVVGDAVNAAARLQSATKELNRGIVIGESTWERVKDRCEAEDLGEISVKGKQIPMRIFCPTSILPLTHGGIGR